MNSLKMILSSVAVAALLGTAALAKPPVHHDHPQRPPMLSTFNGVPPQGGRIGPDLTGSNRSNLDYLLSNLIDPSAEVAQDYRMSIVTTTDGRLLTGMIVERMADRFTLQTLTERIVLAKVAHQIHAAHPRVLRRQSGEHLPAVIAAAVVH